MDINLFANQVSEMRRAQIEYFQLIAKAKKTKLPADFAKAAMRLKESKALEHGVDVAVSQIQSAAQ